jgi:hypothetical protein
LDEREMFLVVEIPPEKTAFVFRIEHIWNQFKILNYGPLPIKANTPLKTFAGTSALAPADGALAPMSFIENLTFPFEGVRNIRDMWLFDPLQDPDRLFVVEQFLTPAFLRVNAHIPVGNIQAFFQRTQLALKISDIFGWKRGHFLMVHFPQVNVGYNYANDTSFALFTHVKFVYDEYIISIPADPALIFNILAGFVSERFIRRITYPIATVTAELKDALIRQYGFLGFPLPRIDRRAEFEARYAGIISSPAVLNSYLARAGGIR